MNKYKTFKPIKFSAVFFSLLAGVYVTDLNFPSSREGQVLGAYDVVEISEVGENRVQLVTETSFEQDEISEEVSIPFEIEYQEDGDLEYGVEEILQEGVVGSKTYHYLITHWLGEEIDRKLLSTDTVAPVTQLVRKGTKIVWKTVYTPDLGEISYWHKMTVFATKYDSTCLGCNNTTALGAPVQQGVCATDPKTISLYTHFYVPGYGKCQALDVGGLIKGNRIDLAYKNAREANWGAAYVDIYLMDNPPY